jgi:hypothetical protein
MFDLKNVDVKALRTDLIKNALILVVVRLLRYYVLENAGNGVGRFSSVMPNDFLYTLVFTLTGFVLFWVVVQPQVAKLQ